MSANMSNYNPKLDKIKARIFIETITSLAKNQIPYEFATGKIIWRLSLYLGTGRFNETWSTYSRISDKAQKLKKSDEKNWKKMVTFEHAEPINIIYKKFFNINTELELNTASQMICEYLPVIITKEEDQEINRRGYKKSGKPEDRYQHIPISFDLKSSPVIFF